MQNTSNLISLADACDVRVRWTYIYTQHPVQSVVCHIQKLHIKQCLNVCTSHISC